MMWAVPSVPFRIIFDDPKLMGPAKYFDGIERDSRTGQYFVKPGVKVARFEIKKPLTLGCEVSLFLDEPLFHPEDKDWYVRFSKEATVTHCPVSIELLSH